MKVSISVADRHSTAGAETEITFRSFPELDRKLNEYLDSLPFHKVNVDIDPEDFVPTKDQKKKLWDISIGEFSPVKKESK